MGRSYPTTADNVTFSYDLLNRRIASGFADSSHAVTNTAGNNAYQWAGYTNGTRSYTANGLNQYTAATGATPAYDSNGNLSGDGTWTYTYDQDNRLRSANKTGQTFALTYDALGRLRHTTKDTFINSDLLYDGTDVVGE